MADRTTLAPTGLDQPKNTAELTNLNVGTAHVTRPSAVW